MSKRTLSDHFDLLEDSIPGLKITRIKPGTLQRLSERAEAEGWDGHRIAAELRDAFVSEEITTHDATDKPEA